MIYPHTKYLRAIIDDLEWYGAYNEEEDRYERHMIDYDGNITVFEVKDTELIDNLDTKLEISRRSYWEVVSNEDMFEKKIEEFEGKAQWSRKNLEEAKEIHRSYVETLSRLRMGKEEALKNIEKQMSV